MIDAHAKGQLLTETEIMMKLRDHGVTNVDAVGAAYMEPDGSFAVLKRS